LVPIIPCNDVDVSERFFARLGFKREGGVQDYRMLKDDRGNALHLQPAVDRWLVPGRNPFAMYLYVEDVDAYAARFAGEIVEGRPERKDWGTYEFSLNAPDDLLVRVGRAVGLK